MKINRYLICFVAIGILFSCDEGLDTVDGFPSPVNSDGHVVESVEKLIQYTPKSMEEFEDVLVVSEHLNKPILIYFTGQNCVNCRKMEEFTWLDPDVFQVLNNEFLIVSLYVDSREESEHSTVGQLWFGYEQDRYRYSTQPLYDIVDSDNRSLVSSFANYNSHSDPDKFLHWLEEGLDKFHLTETTVAKIKDLPIFDVHAQADYDRLLDASNLRNKPVLVHITGYACVGSRKFENRIWVNPQVHSLLKEEFLIARIYVDERTPLPNAENLPDSLNTYGEYWMNYEIERYNRVTQPVDDIVNAKNKSLVKEVATYSNHNDVATYLTWLQEGLANFKKGV